MCFCISKKEKKKKIAHGDLLCYKVMSLHRVKYDALNKRDIDTYMSVYRGTKYDLTPGKIIIAKDNNGNVIKNLRVCKKNGSRIIECGLHSFLCEYRALAEALFLYHESMGYRNGRPENYFYKSPSIRVLQFVIPKGTTYYVNEEMEEFVSTSLCYKRVIAKSGIAQEPHYVDED